MAQRGLHVQLLLAVLGRVREGSEQLQALREVADRFQIGRARNGALPCPLPVGYRLIRQPCLGVVMGQQFGLGLGGCGKALR
jgi:hypothetical protein